MANSNDKNRPPKFRFQNPVNGLQHHVPSPKPSRGKMRLQRGDLDSNAADFDNASMDSELRMASSLFRDSDQFVERVVTKAVGLPLDGPQPMCDSVREAIESECAGADPLQRNHEYPTNIENWVAAVGVAVLIAALVFVLASFAVPTLNDDSELASASQIKNPSEQDLTQPLNPDEKPHPVQKENTSGDTARPLDAQASVTQTDTAEAKQTKMPNAELLTEQPKIDFDATAAMELASKFLDMLMPRDSDTKPSNEMAKPAAKFRVTWQLAVHFGGSDNAEIRVNGHPIGTVSRNDIGEALPLIGEEVKRRFQFLEHAFREPLKGVVTVDQYNFIFREAWEADEAFDRAAGLLAKLSRHTPKRRFRSQYRFRRLVGSGAGQKSRNGYMNGLSQTNEGSIATLDRSLSQASSVDQGDLVYDVVFRTERILRQSLTNKKLTYPLNAPQLFARVVDRDRYLQRITRFVNDGALFLPEGRHARTQILHGRELVAQLQDTAIPLDVFRSEDEFREAEQYIINLRNSTSEEYQKAGVSRAQLLNDWWNRKRAHPEIREPAINSPLDSRLQEIDLTFREVTKPEEPLRAYLERRPDLAGLPLAMGEDCRSNLPQSLTMSAVSSSLGEVLSQFDAFGSRPFETMETRGRSIRAAINKSLFRERERIFDRDQAFRTLEQMLQVDVCEIRMKLVNDLKDHGTPAAVSMLVDRAKFDLDSRVRSAAIKAIRELDQGDAELVRNRLMEGFEYPWHVVAEHSAEALVAFNDKQVLPQLLAQLKKSDPRLPIHRGGKLIQRKLVAVNHLKNCLLCHAPAKQSDSFGVAAVPSWGRQMSPTYYAGNPIRGFVRADVTYLKQDFSVMQTVENAAPWPSRQRFDYVVQERTMDEMEAEQVTAEISKLPNRNRESVLFALKQITGETVPVDDYRAWSKVVSKAMASEN